MPTKPTGLVELHRILSKTNPKALSGRLQRWWHGEFREHGLPKRMSLTDWAEALEALAALPETVRAGLDLPLSDSVRGLVRRSRPDGRLFFDESADAAESLARLSRIIEGLGDGSTARVLAWWRPRKHFKAESAPPLPFDHPAEAPFSVLRADWLKDGHWMGVDYRPGSGRHDFELGVSGRPLLTGFGDPFEPNQGRAKVVEARSGPYFDQLEWGFHSARGRAIRSASMLRGRDLVLLGEEVVRPEPGFTTIWELAEDVTADAPNSDGFCVIRPAKGRSRAWLLPLHPEGATFKIEGRRLIMEPRPGAKRDWLSILIGWGKSPSLIRRLTVSQKMETCTPDEALAVRVGWGRLDDSLFLYRSLEKPCLRAALGHQLKPRYLVALFSNLGKVSPILSLD